MGEIKGQMLCLLLILSIFAAIAGSMYSSFEKARDTIVQNIDAELISSSSN